MTKKYDSPNKIRVFRCSFYDEGLFYIFFRDSLYKTPKLQYKEFSSDENLKLSRKYLKN